MQDQPALVELISNNVAACSNYVEAWACRKHIRRAEDDGTLSSSNAIALDGLLDRRVMAIQSDARYRELRPLCDDEQQAFRVVHHLKAA